MMILVLIYIRSEVKQDEKRTLFLPQHVEDLLKAGFKVTVEKYEFLSNKIHLKYLN